MIVGIDLGTTNSLAAVWRGDAAEMVPNALGQFPPEAYRAAFVVLVLLQAPCVVLYALGRFRRQLQPLADLACDESMACLPERSAA